MEITTGDLFAEAGQMALELRLTNRRIAELEGETERLRQALAETQQPATVVTVSPAGQTAAVVTATPA